MGFRDPVIPEKLSILKALLIRTNGRRFRNGMSTSESRNRMHSYIAAQLLLKVWVRQIYNPGRSNHLFTTCITKSTSSIRSIQPRHTNELIQKFYFQNGDSTRDKQQN